MAMRILVVGGAGYIGSRLCPTLLARGYEVDVVDLFWFGCSFPIPEAHKMGIMANEKNEIGLKKADVFSLTVADLKSYDQVIFLAGLSSDPMAELAPAKNFIYNAAAPAYLAYIAKKAGVRRFVYASSCSVYGYTVDELYDENSPISCGYPYGISKLQGEEAVLHMQDEHFSVIALRKGTVSGYSPRMRLDLLINAMFKSACRDGVITVSNPAIWRPILGIADAVDAYIRAIEANYTISGVFNVASENHTLGEIADLVKEYMGSSIRIELNHVADFRNYKVTWQKAATILSYHARQTTKTILAELSDSLTTTRFDWDDPKYYNIQVLKELNL